MHYPAITCDFILQVINIKNSEPINKYLDHLSIISAWDITVSNEAKVVSSLVSERCKTRANIFQYIHPVQKEKWKEKKKLNKGKYNCWDQGKGNSKHMFSMLTYAFNVRLTGVDHKGFPDYLIWSQKFDQI